MTTLREEIKDIIEAIDICQNFDDETYYRATDNLLSKVEKRIDEMINNSMKKNGSEIREHGNRLEFRIMYTEQIDTLNKVKEMLSK